MSVFPRVIINQVRRQDVSFLLRNGWKHKRTKRRVWILVSPCGQFIVKSGTFVSDKPRRFAVFTRIFGDWSLQPKVDQSNQARKKAWAYFKPISEDQNFYYLDIHDQNVGLFKGQPVLFDW